MRVYKTFCGFNSADLGFTQHIDADSDAFARVNTAENPFKVSIDIECAGVAENNLYSKESGYSNAISNPAILGIAPEFEYTEGLDVKEVVINFDIESGYTSNVDGSYAAVNNEFVGIKRLNVFKFFEDTNMLLPIETFHDVENNRVYTHVDELGTYCLMDMEKWFGSLDIKADEFKTDTTSMNTLAGISSSKAMTMNKLASIKSDGSKELDESIDVFIVPYVKNISDLVIEELDRTVKEIFEKNNNVHLYLVSPIGGLIGDSYVTDYDSALSLINRVPDLKSYSSSDSYMLSKAAKTIFEYSGELRIDSSKYCFVIDAFANPTCASQIAYISQAKANGVEFYFERSRVNDNELYYSTLSGREVYVISPEVGRYNFGDYIVDTLFTDHENEYPIVSAVGWTRIKLDSPIIEEYRSYAFAIENDPTLHDGVVQLNKFADTDDDGLLDLEEIMFQSKLGNDLISFDSNGDAILPNFEECTDALPWNRRMFYVQNGLKRYSDLCNIQDFYKIKILPIKSDPSNEDGDGDKWLDSDDIIPLKTQGLIYADFKIGSTSYISESKAYFNYYFRDNEIRSANSSRDYMFFNKHMKEDLGGYHKEKGLYNNHYNNMFDYDNLQALISSDVGYISGHGCRGGVIPIYPQSTVGVRDSSGEKMYDMALTSNINIEWDEFQNFGKDVPLSKDKLFSLNPNDSDLSNYRLQWLILAACCQLETADDRSPEQINNNWSEESLYNWCNVMSNSNTMKGILGYYHSAPGSTSDLTDYSIIDSFLKTQSNDCNNFDILMSWFVANSWEDDKKVLHSRNCGILVKNDYCSYDLLTSLHMKDHMDNKTEVRYFYYKVVADTQTHIATALEKYEVLGNDLVLIDTIDISKASLQEYSEILNDI